MSKAAHRLALAAIILAVALVAPTPVSSSRKSFGEVIAQLNAGKTFVVSPTSLNVVLHIARDASRGRTAAEVEPLLFDDAMQARNATQDSGVRLLSSSGVWISNRFPGSQKFDALFSHKYGGTVSHVSFESGEGERAIETWISRLSGGDLRGYPIDPLTLFVIANIQVFHGNWALPFDSKNTRPDTFHGRHGDETAQMMWGHDVSSYRAGEYGELAALDYAGPYRLLLFLPKNSTDPPLQTFLKQGFGATFQPWKTSIVLPRLHLNTPELLTRALGDLGMEAAFRGNADFSPMLGAVEHGRGIMFQDVDLKIDEHGTVAKAVTELPVKLQAIPERPIRFDRPFAFAIVRAGATPTILFEGQILDLTDS